MPASYNNVDVTPGEPLSTNCIRITKGTARGTDDAVSVVDAMGLWAVCGVNPDVNLMV